MSLADASDFISRVGFPIAVAAFLLWRHDKHMAALVHNQHRLLSTVRTMAQALGVVVSAEEDSEHPARPVKRVR